METDEYKKLSFDEMVVQDAHERRLRKAAPDLLAALETLTETLGNQTGPNTPNLDPNLIIAFTEARAAIAKAKGEQ